ncbi:hypothetical protein GC387_32600 [Pseudomonas sp. MWU12-2323]|nr:hypothetical protein [Pseudomonas sp. MWU12-2323]RBH57193.1 hypothetical protein C3F00_013235 [Pseudomonas sp. MWU13-2860]
MAIPAPKIRAIIVSRTKPRTREIIVIELTAANDLSRFIKRVCAFGERAGEQSAQLCDTPRRNSTEPKLASLQVRRRK